MKTTTRYHLTPVRMAVIKWDREGGRKGDARGKRYGDICICITHFVIKQKQTHHCKEIIL